MADKKWIKKAMEGAPSEKAQPAKDQNRPSPSKMMTKMYGGKKEKQDG